MYGFRKSISAATFSDSTAFGISLKSALVLAQVLGYMTAKFIGIRFIGSLKKTNRGRHLLLLILTAHFCLLFLAFVPTPWNVIFLFINGLCLGLIWGLVFSFIEGRSYTDFVALMLSINFIFSSGIVKTIGRYTIEWGHVSVVCMPTPLIIKTSPGSADKLKCPRSLVDVPRWLPLISTLALAMGCWSFCEITKPLTDSWAWIARGRAKSSSSQAQSACRSSTGFMNVVF